MLATAWTRALRCRRPVTGQALYFTANRGEIEWMPLDGGMPVTLATGVSFAIGSWGCSSPGYPPASFTTDLFAMGEDALYGIDWSGQSSTAS